MAQQLFYYKSNGHEYGPYSTTQLKAMAAQGVFQPTAQVRREESQNWHPAVKVQGLFNNNPSETSGIVPPPQTAKVSSYFYIDTQNRQIVVDASKIKDLILSGIITAKTIIGNTKDAATRKAGDIPQLANIFTEYQLRPQNQQPQEMVNVLPSVPVPQVNAQPPVPIQNNEVQPAAANDSAMMMAMMKEMLAAKSQQPQIVITNTNTNTNANDGMGAVTYNLFMGFLVWFFFGFCMGGSCYLGRCSSLIVMLALVGAVITVGAGAVLCWIVDFIIVLLTALQKPPTDCHGRRAIYT